MRISDWSSDVCSSDLSLVIAAGELAQKVDLPLIGAYQVANALVSAGLIIATGGDAAHTLANLARLQPVRGRLERAAIRSEERRVGNKSVSTCRSRWSAYPENKKQLYVTYQ